MCCSSFSELCVTPRVFVTFETIEVENVFFFLLKTSNLNGTLDHGIQFQEEVCVDKVVTHVSYYVVHVFRKMSQILNLV